MLAPAAVKAMLAEFSEELDELEETEIKSESEWLAELAAFVDERAGA